VITEDVPAVAPATAFEEFVDGDGVKLRRILVAQYGVDVGTEIHADAIAWAWEHRDELAGVTNRVGYLYRVAQSSARRHWRWRRRPSFPPETAHAPGDPEPGLGAALAKLRESHRVAVLLVHAHGWTYAEVASALGVPVSTVRNHVHRGLTKLRAVLGVRDDD